MASQEDRGNGHHVSTTTSPGHRCCDVWALPPEVFQLEGEKRFHYLYNNATRKTQSGPFPPNSLTTPSPISLLEEATVITYFGILLGGPLVWIVGLLWAILLGTWSQLGWAIVLSVLLSLHPMPSMEWRHRVVVYSWLTRCLYKYFTYRFVWDGDSHIKIKEAVPWIGAGAPHGVIPLSGILSIPGINAVREIKFVGAVASVVFYTPFLRYMTIFPTIPVSASALQQAAYGHKGHPICAGLVPDGIAGIFRQDDASGGKEVVAIRNRKGLARHALRTGTNILPAYSFGNTEILSAWWDPWGCMEKWSRKAQASIFLYWGRFYCLPIPRRVQITMVYGDAIIVPKLHGREPTQEEIDQLHELILAGIRHCFETHKAALGRGDRELIFD